MNYHGNHFRVLLKSTTPQPAPAQPAQDEQSPPPLDLAALTADVKALGQVVEEHKITLNQNAVWPWPTRW